MVKGDIIFNQFTSEIIETLVEFVKYIAKLEDDYIVFMARKSYCLYKALLDTSVVPSQKIITSDRIFDLEYPLLKGKRIALIDDTLIIGTTLADIKQELEANYNAKISIHVFCADEDNWNKEIIQPDKIFLKMKHPELLSFCTSIIRALYVSARPYMVDFPMSKKRKLNIEQLDKIISNAHYKSFDLTNELQVENNIKYFTLIPNKLISNFHKNIQNVIQIFKLRLFVELRNDEPFLTVVPIVTLNSLSRDSVEELFSNLLVDINNNASVIKDQIAKLFVKEKAKYRLIQYLLSCKLLSLFIKDILTFINVKFDILFDRQETEAHFGPSNYVLLNKLEIASLSLFNNNSVYSNVKQVTLPNNVTDLAEEFLNEINNEIDPEADLFTKFTEVFIKFFDKREVPFRQEVKNLGPAIRSATSEDAPFRDRLKIGLPFEIILKYLNDNYKGQNLPIALSIILDICNDLGVAVPITCMEENILFRAYRHGEDVKITDSELSLIYQLIKGFMQASGKSYITQMVLQKIIVLFIKYGIKEHILLPIRSHNSYDNCNKISIEHERKGAVPKLYFSDWKGNIKSEWLTTYLKKKKILRENDEKQIVLGKDVEANHLVSNAPRLSNTFGNIFGRLIWERKDDGDKPISIDDLTILATCDTVLNTLKAIHTEIRIIIKWIKEKDVKSVPWDNKKGLKEYYRNITRAVAYEAFNSAKIKYLGFLGNRNKETINKAENYLAKSADSESSLAVNAWTSYWDGYRDIKNEDMDKFTENIEGYMDLIIQYKKSIEMLLFCIKYKLADGKRIEQNTRKLEEDLEKFIEPIKKVSSRKYQYNEITDRLLKYCNGDLEFPYLNTFKYYFKKMDMICFEMESNYFINENIIKQYGTVAKRHDYKYMVWYDVIDSTSTHIEKDKVNENSKNIDLFKEAINDKLRNIQIIAEKKGVDIYPYLGNIESTDDGKHIFLSGNQSVIEIPFIIENLLETAAACKIYIRLLAIPTSFVSSQVYREIGQTNVEGNSFFIHLSRVKNEIEKIQREYYKNNNFLMILDNRLQNTIVFSNDVIFKPKNARIIISIEQIDTLYDAGYGVISIKK